jgi:AraC-like DNA-binding protein
MPIRRTFRKFEERHLRFEDIVFVYHLRDERQIAWHGRLHGHDEGLYEFHYFISGEGSFRNGDAVYPIQPGTLHMSPPLMTHQILATSLRRPITYYAVLLDPEGDPELLSLLDALGRGSERARGAASPRNVGAPRTIGASHRFFFADLLERSSSDKRELVMAAYHGFLAFLYSLAAGRPAARGSSDNAHVEKALAIMQLSIEKPLGLGELCGRLDLSQEHFVRLFTDRMGMPPMKYYLRLKVEAAKAMLSSTELRVGQIAEKLGYESQFNFTRAFKRISGMSPTDYRATFGGGDNGLHMRHRAPNPRGIGRGKAKSANARARGR